MWYQTLPFPRGEIVNFRSVSLCVCVLMKAKSAEWTMFVDGDLEEKLRTVRVTERGTFPLKPRGWPTI